MALGASIDREHTHLMNLLLLAAVTLCGALSPKCTTFSIEILSFYPLITGSGTTQPKDGHHLNFAVMMTQ